MDISVGDVVTLKSGGPKMTVQGKLDKGMCDCAWFDQQACCMRHTFAQESLEKCCDKEIDKPEAPKIPAAAPAAA